MKKNAETQIQQWLTQIEKVIAEDERLFIYVIVDQAGNAAPLIHGLRRFQPPIRWCSLLEKEPENAWSEDAPLLLRIEVTSWQQKRWFSSLLQQYAEPSRLLLLFSSAGFVEIVDVLHKLVIADLKGHKGVLRFYDNRLFMPLVNEILSQQQRYPFLAIAELWAWRDRDGEPVWMAGEYQGDIELAEDFSLTLNDNQYDQLGFLSDIESFAHRHLLNNPEQSKEMLCRLLWQSLSQPEIRKSIIDSDRFFTEFLASNSACRSS